MNHEEKIQWHPAFYAAAGLELQENIDDLELISEYNLSKEPIRIDLLIIKDSNKSTIKNEIGHIMRTYNVIEYKSPEDGLTIDDFYKTVGYACLYKGYGEYVNQIPLSELTISLFRATYPRELFAELARTGHEIEERYPGIYYVTNLKFPAQIVVTSMLRKEMHSSFRVLTDRVAPDDIERFLKESQNRTSQGERHNIDAVLQASMSANQKVYEEIRRNNGMCKAMEELMKDIIDERVNEGKREAHKEGIKEGITTSRIEDIKSIMASLKLSVEQAMDALNIPPDQRAVLLERI